MNVTKTQTDEELSVVADEIADDDEHQLDSVLIRGSRSGCSRSTMKIATATAVMETVDTASTVVLSPPLTASTSSVPRPG